MQIDALFDNFEEIYMCVIMDKKYFTSKLFIVSGILLIVCGIIIFCYPFFMPEFDQLLFKMIFWSLGFVSLGGAIAFFYAFCFYPVFTKDSIVMRNAVVPSRTRTIKYRDINYATVNKRETGKGYIILQLHFGLIDGGNFTCTLLTDAGQQEELRNELKSYGVTEEPVSDAVIKRVGDKVYRSNGVVALFVGIMMFWIALIAVMGVSMGVDLTFYLVMGIVMFGCVLMILWYSNYVCVEHNRIIIKNFFPFHNKEIYFSDIEKADINDKSLLTITLKNGGKKIKRYLGLLNASLIEDLKIRLKIEN